MSVHAAGPDTGRVATAPRLLLGRDRDLAELYALVDGIDVRGGALVVRGEAGIGKSALLAAARERALERGVSVVSTVGALSEAQLAFAGLHQLLLPLLGGLDLLPDPQRLALEAAFGIAEGDAPDLFLIGLAALGLVAERAAETPLLFVVEDAHWLDRPSGEVLQFVARRIESDPAVLLFAVREGVASCFDDTDLPELPLAGLDEDASNALLDLAPARLPAGFRRRILEEADGNPLALIELPTAAVELGARESDPLPLTARLEQTFASRLTTLDPEVQRLLLLAALDELDLAELGRAAGTPVKPDDLAPAAAAGLGTLDSGTFRFRHPLIVSAIKQAAPADELRSAHAALAEALADEPDRAVWHRAAAASGPDDAIAEALDAAANRAMQRGAGDVAISTFERAAELTGEPPRRALRLYRAGDLARELGRFRDGVRLLRDAQQLGLPPAEHAMAAFHLEIAESTWSGSATIRDFARIARELVDSGDGKRALRALDTIAVRAYWERLDDETRREVAAICDEIAVPPDDPHRLYVQGLIDPLGRGREVVDQIARLSPVGMSDVDELFDVGIVGSAVWADNHAVPFLRATSSTARAQGRMGLLGHTLVFEAWAYVRRGAVRQAITAAAEAVRIGEETRAMRFVMAARFAQAIASAEQGEQESAERLVADAEALLVNLGANPMRSLPAFARGRLALARERFGEAYEQLMRIFDPAGVAFHSFVRGWALADLADAAVRGDGDLDAVRGYLAEWEQIAKTTRAPQLQVQVAYAAAILAPDATAERQFRTAIESAQADWPVYAARAQLAYGEWLRRHRRMTQSRAPLREAAETFDALGMLPYAERARRELRASGETARRRDPGAWAQLSPQELQIAQLAAEGFSNREIGEQLYLSHRTVESHLYRLFPKLGVTSRAQLRNALEPASTS
ncbi:MAG TPA: AAA family ATPase [Gaiellaceae bacterium]|nr:AAA family ATPase [Gaiellaceae bacterium]